MIEAQTAQKIVDDTIKALGRVDILINNAGWTFGMTPIFEQSIENFQKTFDLNLKAAVVLTKLCLPYLRESKGNVVNVSSVGSVQNYDNLSFYCMSKAALDMFTKCLASEEGKNGIRVNSVNPGFVDTRNLFSKKLFCNFIQFFRKSLKLFPTLLIFLLN